MSYWDDSEIRKRVTQRYRRRFKYLAIMLVYVLFFAIMWYSGDRVSVSTAYIRPDGSIVYQDGTLYYVGALVSLVIPILHTVYFLYQEVLERALHREMEHGQKMRERLLDDNAYRHLNDDSETPAEAVYQPKRKRSS